jgi:hypothetical protein
MPRLDFVPQDGGIPTNEKLLRVVENLLHDRKSPADAVIALTDVYTGKNPPLFTDANDAKQKLNQWVRGNPKFYPHVALHDFEAWLLPYPWLGDSKDAARVFHQPIRLDRGLLGRMGP